MVNFPKELKSYCRNEQCKNHQDWRVSQYKVRSLIHLISVACSPSRFQFNRHAVITRLLCSFALADAWLQAGKASLFAQGKRRYDRKQAGFGGQVRPLRRASNYFVAHPVANFVLMNI